MSDNEQPGDAGFVHLGIDLAQGLDKSSRFLRDRGSFSLELPNDLYFYWDEFSSIDPKDIFAAAKGPTFSVPDIINEPAPQPTEPPAYIPPPDGPVRTAPQHTKSVFDISTLPLLVRWAEDLIYQLKADAIVACGHSGLVLAGAVSYATRVPVVAVRKPGEPVVARDSATVSTNLVRPAERWVWLDDFLASGGTFKNAVRELKRLEVVAVEQPVAILSYHASQESIDMWPSDTGFPRGAIREYGYRE